MTSSRRRDGNGSGSRSPRRVIIPDNVPEYYVNSLHTGTTAWDFMLFFGSTILPELLQTSQDQNTPVQTRVDCVIRMSPQHAKATARALQSAVAGYEERFGEITIPEVGAQE